MSGLADVLSHSLVVHPVLFHELPGLISALDAGKQVVIDQQSSDPLQATILRILQELPTNCSTASVWTKSDCLSLNRTIVSHLLSSQTIIQPQELSLDERLAVKSCKTLIRILESNHDILPDIVSLLKNLLDGEGVDVSGLENPTLKDDLTTFFHHLDMEDNEGVFSLSGLSDSQNRLSRKAIKTILASLRTKSPVPIQENSPIVSQPVFLPCQSHDPRSIGPSLGVSYHSSIQVTDLQLVFRKLLCRILMTPVRTRRAPCRPPLEMK
jgi:hypothetical protein